MLMLATTAFGVITTLPTTSIILLKLAVLPDNTVALTRWFPAGTFPDAVGELPADARITNALP